MNSLKLFVLMAGLTALLVALGAYFGGETGLVIALVFAIGTNFFMYFQSDKLVLRAYRARIVSREEAPELYDIVDGLRQRVGIPMPTIAIAPKAQPNAFATGRDAEHAVVCVTEGILKVVDRDELEGVLAHELGHVLNHDMLLQTVGATLAGAVSNLARFGWLAEMWGVGGNDDDRGNPATGLLMIIVAPIAAMLIQFAISRQREYKADATGAKITGRPLELASALRKLDAASHRIPMKVSPAAASLALVNPLAAYNSIITRLFSTHPPTAGRIERLDQMAAAMHEVTSRAGS
ncbi:MAG TPA: zinc metalloprotease HtpX [Gemmatimonadaceae bacterium]|nr:zinc metalloprotease HtpX [Gemmatimonadaceae bacterium]